MSDLFGNDYKGRKAIPIWTGLIDYFPAALVEVAKVSALGNEQHNKGEELHWARGKSMNQIDTAMRHMMDSRYTPRDSDGAYHLAKAIWRLAAELELYLEQNEGAPMARGAREAHSSTPTKTARDELYADAERFVMPDQKLGSD